MSHYERFRSAFSVALDGWSSSLPVCNEQTEIIFFYQTGKAAAGNSFFSSITKVVERDRRTGELSESDPEELTSRVIAEGSGLRTGLTGMEALAAKKDYLTAYEQYIAAADAAETDDFLRQMKESFQQLVPPSALRRAYFAVCPEFFEKIGVTQD